MLSPRVTEAINQLVGSERRATILSTQSVMTFLLFIPTSAEASWVSGRWGIQTSLFAIALYIGFASRALVIGGYGELMASQVRKPLKDAPAVRQP